MSTALFSYIFRKEKYEGKQRPCLQLCPCPYLFHRKKKQTQVKVISNHTVDQEQVDSGTERFSEGLKLPHMCFYQPPNLIREADSEHSSCWNSEN